MRRSAAFGAAVAAIALPAGCGGGRRAADTCSNADGALGNAAFVFVLAPASGERVRSGFRAGGCSSTYEATVTWRLVATDGHVLASGFTQGGNPGPGPFAFTVRYTMGRRQIGSLEVAGTSGATPPEGFPPPRDVVPLVLEP
jgi:hypothetical protein